MNSKLALSALLSLTLALAACGDSEEKKTGGGGAGGGGGGGAAKQSASVKEADIQFAPKAVTVAKGGTVTWTNEDTAPHDVTKVSGPGPKFASGKGDMKKGDTYKHKFNTAGTIKYMCTVHPTMTGEVVVK